ncbi:class F sortase [Allobranchiibius huperziae]|uniref:LPXTG-site transpeptidase (Sortase) family protein n=1 Tax=Allobranchiibius huperziae TaxID=1874116 RepID=A0A853DFI8_9MICO|nr:class F sortase [Allobranchiibius huperziae]NYJ74739.1 LPXTG-site transpeptidase (sortase) family protein [Allobranchiibius huperziae]
MKNRTRAQTIAIGVLCACLVLGGIVAIVWGTHRPAHTDAIPLPASQTSSSSTSPASPSVTSPSTSSSANSPAAAPLSPPSKISIPSLNEGSTLLTLGATANREIVVPDDKHADQAGWFTGSPTPGAVGPATIVGHVTSSRGGAVFYHLAQIKNGATVTVTLKSGKVLTYDVYRVVSVPKDNFPTQAVYGNTTDPELRLITCGGSFDSATGHFRNNTVVYARLAA